VKLYRGFGNNHELIIRKFNAELTDRSPRHTPVKIHEFLNNWLSQNYGKPWRNGVFTTTMKTEAELYGAVYNFVPIGEFEFLYSPDILDMQSDFKRVVKNKLSMVEWLQSTDEAIQLVHDQLENSRFVLGNKNNVMSLTNSLGNEIIFWCKEYYLINQEIYQEMEQQI
jgi:hypothetical protein